MAMATALSVEVGSYAPPVPLVDVIWAKIEPKSDDSRILKGG